MVIEFNEVYFTYANNKEEPVLKNVSFSVEKGYTLAIVGASGSGKSTILRILAQLLPQNNDEMTGEVRVDTKMQDSLSFMFQEPALLPHFNVYQNIAIPLELKDIDANKKVQEIMTHVGLERFKEYLPKNLSGGMKTRTALARSFITSPQLLLLDEPFSSLDTAWRHQLYDQLKLLKKENKTTVVLVTHDIDEAIYLADSVICIGMNGQIIYQTNDLKKDNIYTEIKDIIISDHKVNREYEKYD